MAFPHFKAFGGLFVTFLVVSANPEVAAGGIFNDETGRILHFRDFRNFNALG